MGSTQRLWTNAREIKVRASRAPYKSAFLFTTRTSDIGVVYEGVITVKMEG